MDLRKFIKTSFADLATRVTHPRKKSRKTRGCSTTSQSSHGGPAAPAGLSPQVFPPSPQHDSQISCHSLSSLNSFSAMDSSDAWRVPDDFASEGSCTGFDVMYPNVPFLSDCSGLHTPPGEPWPVQTTAAQNYTVDVLGLHAVRLQGVLSETKRELDAFIERVSSADISLSGSSRGERHVTASAPVGSYLREQPGTANRLSNRAGHFPGRIVDGMFVPQKNGRQSFKGGVADLRETLTRVSEGIQDARLPSLRPCVKPSDF
jgi:hypothetical protein